MTDAPREPEPWMWVRFNAEIGLFEPCARQDAQAVIVPVSALTCDREDGPTDPVGDLRRAMGYEAGPVSRPRVGHSILRDAYEPWAIKTAVMEDAIAALFDRITVRPEVAPLVRLDEGGVFAGLGDEPC